MSLLELKNITKSFGRLTALRDINITVEEGEVLGIVGPNGSGKTTLVNVISGYHRPTSGEIYLAGEKTSSLYPFQIATRGIIRSFQSNTMFEDASVIQSVMLCSSLQYTTNLLQAFLQLKAYTRERAKIMERAHQILKMLGLGNEGQAKASGLSHGYQRTLGIAMALAAKPKVLILDEPTTGMNHEEAMFIVDIVKKINSLGVSVILVEHNMKVMMNLSTRVVVLNFGNKIADGNPREIMNQPEVIDAYLGV
jgi:branched-chain amino acid transport system ATP-binding protein